MDYESFRLEITDGIAHLRFSRPDICNAMTPAFWQELPRAVSDISARAKARVIVLSAEGKHFTAGMDTAVFMDAGDHDDADSPSIAAEAFRRHLKCLQETFTALENARQPVLAAIQGGAIGAGVDLVAACDCRYASSDAFFCVRETAVGITADAGTFPRLCRIMPEGWARQMVYTAERVPAERALQTGLVNRVYDTHEALTEGVLEIAATIAGHSPLAVTGCKQLMNHSRDHSVADTLDYVALWNAAMLSMPDIRESYRAQREKRTPRYPDLLPEKKSL